MLTIHEFGKENKDILVLIHPAVVMWDYFEYMIPLMENKYHLVIPALPGYDESRPRDFTSVKDIAEDLEKWLEEHGYSEIAGIYGCSLGGAVVLRFLADDRILTKCAVIDGGITPYRLPWLLTRLIAVRDFALIALGKLGGMKLLEKRYREKCGEIDLILLERETIVFVEVKTRLSDQEALAYLSGETIRGNISGWTLMTWRDLVLGWGKGSEGTIKNHYPKGLRGSRFIP